VTGLADHIQVSAGLEDSIDVLVVGRLRELLSHLAHQVRKPHELIVTRVETLLDVAHVQRLTVLDGAVASSDFTAWYGDEVRGFDEMDSVPAKFVPILVGARSAIVNPFDVNGGANGIPDVVGRWIDD